MHPTHTSGGAVTSLTTRGCGGAGAYHVHVIPAVRGGVQALCGTPCSSVIRVAAPAPADMSGHGASGGAAADHAREGPPPGEERERLGWLASSSMASKKRNYIEGVSGKGVVELQAQLYRAQEQARMRADGSVDVQDRHVRRKAGIDVASIRNKGVEAREARDRALFLKSSGSGSERLAESAAALQRKAELYDRLAAQRGGADEDEDDRYEVEFWRKGASHQQEEQQWQQQEQQEQQWLQQQQQQQQQQQGGHAPDSAAAAVAGSGDMMSADMARESERRAWEAHEEERLAAQAAADARRAAHRAAIRELSGQTQLGREEAAAAKSAKEEALAAKRARLKAAFLNQQVKAIVASKQQQQQGKAKAAAGGSGGSKRAGAAGSGGAAASSK